MQKNAKKKGNNKASIKERLEHFHITAHEVIELFEDLVENTWDGREKELVHPGNSLDRRLFESIARLTISVALEGVLLRRKKDQIEVFMLQRGKEESFSGQWHTPGSVFRPGEFPKDVVRRLSEREFKTTVSLMSDCIADSLVQESRGWFLSRVYLVEAEGKPNAKGRWFPVSKLPKNTISFHKNFVIPKAVKEFKKII